MWWAVFLFAATPVSPEASAITFDEALAAIAPADSSADSIDSVVDVSAQGRAVQLRRAGQHESLFTSNPQLVLQPGLRVETGVARPEGQLTLTQSLNLSGLGAARSAVQRSELELASLEHQLLRQERRLAVASAWVELWAAQEASRLAHDEEANSRELLERIQRANATGGATRVELATARAFAAELAALHLEWEGRRVEAGAALSELLGLRALAAAAGPLPVLGETDLAALAPERQLLVKVAAREVLGEQARLDESVAQWGPQLQLSVQGGHEAPSQWFANTGVGLTFPVLEQGRRERVAHQAALARLNGAQALAEQRARVRIQLAMHELEHTAETLRVLTEELLPAAEEAVTLETRRFSLGEATFLELSLLRRQALTARITTALARARFAGARARARELEAVP
ncbi:MAG: TolC family protein [Archangium sp.]|nr:TolC family protein [Archangium sp.]